ncbi:hypothetical protein, partial [Vagococcus fluvialis]|uniref:hypothetical protein n=1 Tax=Vagococcus fluvialis TaxID=2738 RepID=UPI003B20BFCB
VVKLVMRKSSYKISVVVTLILQNGLSFYLPKISIYTKYFTLSSLNLPIIINLQKHIIDKLSLSF